MFHCYSHSIILNHGRALEFQRKFFLCATKSRLTDPSEICTLDFKAEFRRSAICSVSATIDIARSIFHEILGEGRVSSLPKKTVSDGEAHIRR
jgi:hypothetical protein